MKVDTENWDKLSKNLGIDLEKYQSKDISGAINALVNTPFSVVFQFVLWPLLFIVSFTLIGVFMIWPQSWAAGILWILTALLIGPLCGITVATYWVIASLDESSRKLYEATLDAIKDISIDIKLNSDKVLTNLELPNYKELLRFVKLQLVFPAIKELMIKKLWPFGNWIGNIVVNYMKKVSQKSEQLIKNEALLLSEGSDQIKQYADKIYQNTDLLKANLDKAHKIATSLTLAPIKFTIYMSLILKALLLLLIWYFFL